MRTNTIILLCMLSSGCSTFIEFPDKDWDVDSSTDTGIDQDPTDQLDPTDSADPDAIADPDTTDDADAAEAIACAPDGPCCASGVRINSCWYDSAEHLMWQDPPEGNLDWNEANAYCGSLSTEGYSAGEWRVPTISELRTLFRGCPKLEDGGDCGITDTCNEVAEPCTSWPDPDCDCSDNCSTLFCPSSEGPGTGGLYWPSPLLDQDMYTLWSATIADDGTTYKSWAADFGGTSTPEIFHSNQAWNGGVRCVRTEP